VPLSPTQKRSARRKRARQFASDPIGRAQDIARRIAAAQRTTHAQRGATDTEDRRLWARLSEQSVEQSGIHSRAAFAQALATTCPVHGDAPCWLLDGHPALCKHRIHAAGFGCAKSYPVPGRRR
jgi:hypothetical protein